MSDEFRNSVSPDGTGFDLTGPSDAPVLALVHGLGLCRRLWDEIVPTLAGSYRVLNYDLYGHGNSRPPRSEASLSLYSDQLAGLMEYLNIEKAGIIGFSIGGMINRRFAMDYPDRVSALIILNSPHDRGGEAQEMVEARALKVREQGAMATLDEALLRWFTPDYRAHGTGMKEVQKWREAVDPESYAQAAWVLANGVRELIRPTRPIVKPSLVMTCENDSGSTPEMSYDIAREIEGSQTIVIPNLQHLGLMERPGLFAEPILEFLERNLK